MPELPEVETVRKKLEQHVLNKKISSVEVLVNRIIRTPDVENFIKKVKGKTFKHIGRKGKHLIFQLDDEYIVSHLRMEGKYEYINSSFPLNKHDHVIFHLNNGYDLRYNDVRKFGTMDLVQSPFDVKSVAELGPEPLSDELNDSYLTQVLRAKKSSIKHALLDQSVIAGLGNIYVDEVLFSSKIHPEKDANKLSKTDIKSLIVSVKKIISLAIENGGSSVRSYNSLGEKGSMQSFHKVYGKEHTPCPNCKTSIEKTRVAGRGTHYCPLCQKK